MTAFQTNVDICNVALGYIGVESIVSMTADSATADACNFHYPKARRQVLTDARWKFAVKRQVLATTTMPAGYPEYDYAYAPPNDCIRVNELFDENGTGEQDFKLVMNDSDQQLIISNTASAVLEYNYDIETVTRFSDAFCDMLAVYLASILASALLKDLEMRATLLEEYAGLRRTLTKSLNSKEKQRIKRETTHVNWVSARHA